MIRIYNYGRIWKSWWKPSFKNGRRTDRQQLASGVLSPKKNSRKNAIIICSVWSDKAVPVYFLVSVEHDAAKIFVQFQFETAMHSFFDIICIRLCASSIHESRRASAKRRLQSVGIQWSRLVALPYLFNPFFSSLIGPCMAVPGVDSIDLLPKRERNSLLNIFGTSSPAAALQTGFASVVKVFAWTTEPHFSQ